MINLETPVGPTDTDIDALVWYREAQRLREQRNALLIVARPHLEACDDPEVRGILAWCSQEEPETPEELSVYLDRAPTPDEVRKHMRDYPSGDDNDSLWMGLDAMAHIVRMCVAGNEVMVAFDDGPHVDWWPMDDIPGRQWRPCDELGTPVAWPNMASNEGGKQEKENGVKILDPGNVA